MINNNILKDILDMKKSMEQNSRDIELILRRLRQLMDMNTIPSRS